MGSCPVQARIVPQAVPEVGRFSCHSGGQRRTPATASSSRSRRRCAAACTGSSPLARGTLEQAQSARTVIVETRKPCRIVAEARRIEVRNLRLEFLRELSDVVQAKEPSRQASGLLPLETEQSSQVFAHPAMLRQQGFSNRGYVEAVKDQRMPPWPAFWLQRLGFAPEAKDVQLRFRHQRERPRSRSDVAFSVGRSTLPREGRIGPARTPGTVANAAVPRRQGLATCIGSPPPCCSYLPTVPFDVNRLVAVAPLAYLQDDSSAFSLGRPVHRPAGTLTHRRLGGHTHPLTPVQTALSLRIRNKHLTCSSSGSRKETPFVRNHAECFEFLDRTAPNAKRNGITL